MGKPAKGGDVPIPGGIQIAEIPAHRGSRTTWGDERKWGGGVQSTKMPGLGVRTAEGQGLSILRSFWSQKLPHSLPKRENKPCIKQRVGVGDASAQA